MAVLELRNISKSFGAVQAVCDVSFTLEAGSVLGLMGDNGAGKSTLVKIISGILCPTSGSLRIEEMPVAFSKPKDARREGIEVVPQDLALCNNLTAAANVYLGREITRGPKIFGLLNHRAMNERAAKLFEELHADAPPDSLVRSFSGGQRQAVAIARTLLSNPKIVLLDEPTAAISVRQVGEVLGLVKRLRDRGVGVVLISHRMPDIFEVCDRVVVMRRGRKVADKALVQSSPEELTGLITGALEAA